MILMVNYKEKWNNDLMIVILFIVTVYLSGSQLVAHVTIGIKEYVEKSGKNFFFFFSQKALCKDGILIYKVHK